MRIHIDHEYRCSPDTFWDKVFFDDEYNRGLFMDGLRFKAYEKLELTDKGDTLFRRIRGTPESQIPGAIQKVIGADLSYVEEATFDKKARRVTFKNIPARMADKLRISGTIHAEPSGAGRCRRIVDIDLEAKFFGVGGLIENFAAKEFRENFDRAATWTNRWLTDQGLEGK